ncbi:MAG: hypothetical protein Q8Q31_04210 [Nanoarchaeota archaeon]|nr:hypothetical protein [Nanoarchaeota archaeon]
MKEAHAEIGNTEKIVVTLSTLIALLSVVFFVLTVFFPGSLSKIGFTGYATAGNTTSGIVNLTVQQGLVINFTTDIIDWGAGSVNLGALNATLDTSRVGAEKRVLNGNWSMFNGSTNYNRTNGLVLQNIGNVNATIYLKTGKNASSFLGGTSPSYQYNVTNNETGSCGQSNATAGNATLGLYYEVNATNGDGTKICDWFNFDDAKDALRIHVLLRVPSDSKTSNLQDTITATAVAS